MLALYMELNAPGQTWVAAPRESEYSAGRKNPRALPGQESCNELVFA